MRETVGVAVSFSWEPFTVDGKHLTFQQHKITRLEKRLCSHWGPAVYKWEGELGEGGHEGKVGVLIGETDDLKDRIKMYIAGTQSMNKRCREEFLTKGIVRLHVLGQIGGQVTLAGRDITRIPRVPLGGHALSSDHVRKLLERLLILKEVEETDPSKTWIVNREWSRRP